MPLDELHHVFLQSCMSRRAFSEKTGQAVYAHCWKLCKGTELSKTPDAPSYGDIVDEINSNIEAFGFHIKRFLDEHSGKPWTAFVNTKSDDLAKVATEYTPQEIAYFRKVIKLIMKSGDRYAIPSNVAKSAGKTVRPELKLVEAEKILRTFVAKGWLIASSVKAGSKKMDMYQLSSRARMELEHYLAEQYPNQMDKEFECKVCNEIVMKGVQCPNNECSTRMHDSCTRLYFTRNRPICPGCQSEWDPEAARRIGPEAREGAGAVGSSDSEADEEAGASANAEGSGSEAPASTAKRASKGQGKAKSTGKGKGKATSDAEEDGDDMDEDAETEAPRQSRRTSGSRNATQQDRLGAESEEEEKNVRMTATQEEDESEEERDELEDDDDDDDEDDPIAARRAAKKQKEQAKKRKATNQSGR